MTNILVTGASGFVGHSLLEQFLQQDYTVRATYHRSKPGMSPDYNSAVNWINYDLGASDIDYEKLLDGIDVVIHLAARVHVMHESGNKLDIYRKVNTDGTRLIADAAARKGVKRFVFLSTVKVHGENTGETPAQSRRFSESDNPAPVDPYAISKLEAEEVIKNICKDCSMDYVVLRPPLIYGPGVKANFLRLIRLAEKGWPLPLASIKNLRSMLYVENLCHVILTCIEHTKAANQIYLVSDTDISVPDLINKISHCLGKKATLFPCPVALLKLAGRLTGKHEVIARLTDSLLIDNSKLVNELHWQPPVDIDEALKKTVNWYFESRQH